MPKLEFLEEWSEQPINHDKRFNFSVQIVMGEAGSQSRQTQNIVLENITYNEFVAWQTLFKQPVDTLNEAALARVKNDRNRIAG